MKYQIFVFKSYYNSTFVLNVDQNTKIEDIYKITSDKINIPIKYICLTYSGKFLSDKQKPITFYNIYKDSTLHLYTRINSLDTKCLSNE